MSGHRFAEVNLLQPTFCCHCDKFIWGLAKQGSRCDRCSAVAHHRCATLVTDACAAGFDSLVQGEGAASRPAHSFAVTNYYRPTFCRHCGSLLWGLCKQGSRCKLCKVSVHNKCVDKVYMGCK